MSILLPNDDRGENGQEAAPPEHVKEITILWDTKACAASIKHDPKDWGCWAGIAGVLEAAATTARLNYHLNIAARIQQQQQEAMASGIQAQQELERIKQLGKQMGHVIPQGKRRL